MDLEKFRKKLVERQDELRRGLEQNKQSTQSVELDQSRVGRVSRMDSMQIQAMAVEVERRNALELRRVQHALSRIDNDDYGYCVECDELIVEGRLEIDPSTALCVQCASKLEQR